MTATRLPRITMATALVLAPVTGLVAALAVPAVSSSSRGEIAAAAGSPGRFYVYALAILLSGYLMVPAFFGVMAVLRGSAPRWAAIAGGLTQAGLLVAVGDGATELLYWQMGTPGADRSAMVALADRYGNAAGAASIYSIGALAMVIGTALTAIALWRTRVLPRWAAVVLVVAVIANLGGFALASRPLLVASYLLLLAAFAPAAGVLFGSRPVAAPTAVGDHEAAVAAG